MRWFTLILLCTIIITVCSEPDPKKYKPGDVEKDKRSGPTLTDDEKTFLREVEEKFGVKSQVPIVNGQNATQVKSTNASEKTPLPAVIAIEIVNDTDSKSQEKRTIDANLGYGYRTNDGYTYTYFGKPKREKGKFVIYPYSQQDSSISSQYNEDSFSYSRHSSGKNSEKTSVEIQPSQAFELVPEKEEHYGGSSKSLENSQEYIKETSTLHPSTLYTTYNGEGLSGLSGQFPSLMSNYFVDPKQLLTNPQYQNIGLTQDHLSSNGLEQNHPVVPVLILRVPSSYLKNPTAELYANLPNNYPNSNYLNNVNLQDLVNQYFKKNGYNFAPQIMTYQKPHIANSAIPSTSASYNSETQQYSNPHVQPSYTQSDYSGVQYSAVKPVMAKYPSSFYKEKYLSSQIQYRRPVHQQQQQQQKYGYRYQYVPQSAAHEQAIYDQSFYQNPQQSSVASYEQHSEHAAVVKPSSFDIVGDPKLGKSQYSPNQDSKIFSVEYNSNSNSQSSQTENSNIESQYDYSKESQSSFSPEQIVPQDYSSQSFQSVNPSDYTPEQVSEYLAKNQFTNAEAISAFSSPAPNVKEDQQSYSGVSPTQGYDYSKPTEVGGNSYVLSENYPSKEHTIATVLPFSYKQPRKPNSATIQTVSYVTPQPHSSKYQSRFRIMVPQTILTGQEKVTYVNSMPMHYTKAGYYNQDYSSEEYNIGNQYNQQLSKQNSPSFSKSYHNSYPKRMVRPEKKPEGSSISSQTKKVSDSSKSS